MKYNLLLFHNSVVSVFSSAYKHTHTHTLRFSKSINYIAYRRYLTIRNIVLLNYFRSLSQQRTTPSPYCKRTVLEMITYRSYNSITRCCTSKSWISSSTTCLRMWRSWNYWHVQEISFRWCELCCIILLEADIRRWRHSGYKKMDMLNNNPQVGQVV